MNKKGQNKKIGLNAQIWFGGLFNFTEFINNEKERERKSDFLDKIKGITKNKVQINNFNLFLNKYIPIIKATINDGKSEKEWFSLKGECIGGESKKPFLEGLVEKKYNFDECLKKIKTFMEEQKNSLKNQKYDLIFSGSLKTQERLIIGLGSTNVLETSIALHHIYGIPYIPASALKGVCRMVAFWKIAEEKNILSDEEKLNDLQKEFFGNLSSERLVLKYQLLFGAQNFKGLLLFYDVYPEFEGDNKIFELDIMNVHYPSYYSDEEGKIPPGDWENPNPIFFLTLKPGINFNFFVFFDKLRAKEIVKMDDEKLEKIAIPKEAKELIKEFEKENLFSSNRNLILEALKNFGIGGKSRLSYGIFE